MLVGSPKLVGSPPSKIQNKQVKLSAQNISLQLSWAWNMHTPIFNRVVEEVGLDQMPSLCLCLCEPSVASPSSRDSSENVCAAPGLLCPSVHIYHSPGNCDESEKLIMHTVTVKHILAGPALVLSSSSYRQRTGTEFF